MRSSFLLKSMTVNTYGIHNIVCFFHRTTIVIKSCNGMQNYHDISASNQYTYPHLLRCKAVQGELIINLSYRNTLTATVSTIDFKMIRLAIPTVFFESMAMKTVHSQCLSEKPKEPFFCVSWAVQVIYV